MKCINDIWQTLKMLNEKLSLLNIKPHFVCLLASATHTHTNINWILYPIQWIIRFFSSFILGFTSEWIMILLPTEDLKERVKLPKSYQTYYSHLSDWKPQSWNNDGGGHPSYFQAELCWSWRYTRGKLFLLTLIKVRAGMNLLCTVCQSVNVGSDARPAIIVKYTVC